MFASSSTYTVTAHTNLQSNTHTNTHTDSEQQWHEKSICTADAQRQSTEFTSQLSVTLKLTDPRIHHEDSKDIISQDSFGIASKTCIDGYIIRKHAGI